MVEGIKHFYKMDHNWKFPDVQLKLYDVPSCSKFNSNDSFTRSVFFARDRFELNDSDEERSKRHRRFPGFENSGDRFDFSLKNCF